MLTSSIDKIVLAGQGLLVRKEVLSYCTLLVKWVGFLFADYSALLSNKDNNFNILILLLLLCQPYINMLHRTNQTKYVITEPYVRTNTQTHVQELSKYFCTLQATFGGSRIFK